MVHQIWTNSPASYEVFRSGKAFCPAIQKQGPGRMSRILMSLIASIGIVATLTSSAHASPACVKGEKPFALTGDTMAWTIYAAPGFECIQGLRWSYMQISDVSIAKAPTQGKVVIVGSGFRYFGSPKDNDADS